VIRPRFVAFRHGGLAVRIGGGEDAHFPWSAYPKAIPVGELVLETLASGRIRVAYTAEGSGEIVKEVQRQTWRLPFFAANYTGQFILRVAIPGGAPIGVHTYQG
jgi:hypothetical protein